MEFRAGRGREVPWRCDYNGDGQTATFSAGAKLFRQSGSASRVLLGYSHHISLILGIISFSGGVVSTCIGKTRAPHARRTVYRSKEPSTFWWLVAMYYLGALLFVGRYLYQGP